MTKVEELLKELLRKMAIHKMDTMMNRHLVDDIIREARSEGVAEGKGWVYGWLATVGDTITIRKPRGATNQTLERPAPGRYYLANADEIDKYLADTAAVLAPTKENP